MPTKILFREILFRKLKRPKLLLLESNLQSAKSASPRSVNVDNSERPSD
jgi:hypothetical protein